MRYAPGRSRLNLSDQPDGSFPFRPCRGRQSGDRGIFFDRFAEAVSVAASGPPDPGCLASLAHPCLLHPGEWCCDSAELAYRDVKLFVVSSCGRASLFIALMAELRRGKSRVSADVTEELVDLGARRLAGPAVLGAGVARQLVHAK